jgi:predicted ester cyclase
MRRALIPLAIVLALATGAVLAETRQVLVAPTGTVANARVEGATALVRRFYAAANDALATGDTAPLGSILADDFVDHAARPGTSPDRTGFLRALLSLRETAPGLRLTALDLVAQGNRVAVRVGTQGGGGAAFLGIPVPAASLWGATEVLRIDAGRVTERWGDTTGLGFFDPLLSVAVPIEAPAGKAVTLERWTYAPGVGEAQATNLGFLVLLVETGELTAEVTPGANAARPVVGGKQGTAGVGRALAPGIAEVLAPGSALVVPQGNRVAVRNGGSVVAVVLAVVATVPAPADRSPELSIPVPTGPTHTVLAGGPTANLPVGEATVAIGRAAVGTGVALPAHRVGIAEFVAVEAGSLALRADDGAWVSALPNAIAGRTDAGPVAAGGGVRVEGGTTVGYFVAGDGPLGIAVVAIDGVPSRHW